MRGTEKEINHIIDSHVGMTESMTRDLHNAAAAIAKWLSEGVVWKGEGRAENLKEYAMPCLAVDLPDNGWLEIGKDLCKDGQLVSVTVKIVEGTKDE